MIDAHVHLNEIADPEAAIQKAKAAGIEHIIAVGMEAASNRATLALNQRFPRMVYPAIGYHPWSIRPEEIDENLEFIGEYLKGCVALGEVGLDYQAKVKKKLQQEIFGELLALAVQLDKPVIIHTRFSQPRALKMVREAGLRQAVFHWYSGPLEVLQDILDRGYFISATPALAYSPPHQQAVQAAPLAQILIETDAPVEYQGRVSEPADLIFTARQVSRIKKVDLEQVQEVTAANTSRFLGI